MTPSSPIGGLPLTLLRSNERLATSEGRPGHSAVVLLAAGDHESTDRATVCAARLAVSIDAALRIVHVIAPVQFRVGRLAPTRIIDQRASDPFASDVLVRARALAWRHGVAATLELVAGDVARVVVETARRVDAHALVLSDPDHHGLIGRSSGPRRWIERHAPCPIITPSTSEHTRWRDPNRSDDS